MARGKVQARIAELMAPVIADAQMSRKEWLERLTKCCRFDPVRCLMQWANRKRSLNSTRMSGRSRGFEVSETSKARRIDARQLKRTKKFKFVDRLSALALIGKACHWYADRQEQTGPDGGPIPQNITVQFVDASVSPEEAYRRMVGNSP